MDSQALNALLNAVANGEISPETAQEKLKNLTFEPIADFAKVDHHRALRTGFPEVIWGPGKTPDQIAQIMLAMSNRANVIMATRIDAPVFQQVKSQIRDVQYYPLPRICVLETASPTPQPGTIGVLSAGTADIPVAEEAALTAQLCGFTVKRLWDVGVAGIHRLLSHRDLLNQVNVLIVVAGMEGALPSVVAGMVDCPVIAVPTSIGYGASFEGIAPLLTMLNSCAAGIGVVNIDNGFGAAILAGQILRTAGKINR
ncbi:MAG: nickel pincer cofactor biosynthesis protein LarB [Cyanobacteria bacterium]|jgi:NCAIR mutase (PurE)-related protein|nr:nickel pincer cofactor biosynthesis protein LarB [Cyanobacteria bacterium GSL.Bin1]